MKTLTALIAAVAGLMGSIPAAAAHTPDMDRPHHGPHSTTIRAAALFPPHWRAWAQCTLTRETGAVLDVPRSRANANSPGGKGRWQFITPWQSGGPYMIADRLVAFGMPRADARQVRKTLQATPIYEWNGWFQDVLAREVVARGGALKHWWGRCDRLAP